jgi:hypothetical protein
MFSETVEKICDEDRDRRLVHLVRVCSDILNEGEAWCAENIGPDIEIYLSRGECPDQSVA